MTATISGDVIRGMSDTIILAVLMEGDSYGYSISKRIREATMGNYTLKETTLYAALTRLEKNGMVHSYAGEITQGKPRTYFSITDDGKAYYWDKREEWQLTKEVIDAVVRRKP